jgi:RimJ/RimL family protein N-acetyltransferase
MFKNEKFESVRLIFRGIRAEDAEKIVLWRSDPAAYKYFRNPKPVSLEEHLDWYENNYLKNPARAGFIVIEKESMTAIGFVGMSSMDEKSGEISYHIGEKNFLRRGFGVESINAAVNFFSQKGIGVFYAEIHPQNIASIKTIEKCNFAFEKKLESEFLQYKLEGCRHRRRHGAFYAHVRTCGGFCCARVRMRFFYRRRRTH